MYMRTALIIAVLSVLAIMPGELCGQVLPQARDKYTLLTVPYNARPLTLYRGQFMAEAGYKFAIRTQSYNADGDIVYLRSRGTGSVYHYYYIDARYGVTDFLQLGAGTSMIRRGIREESTTYVSTTLTSSDRVTVNKLTEVKGMGDILILASLRLPIRYRWFDLSSTGGLYLPSSNHEPEKPTNKVTDVTAANSYTVNYHYNLTYGYGVPVWLLSASLKAGFRKFTAEGDFTFTTPRNEGTNIRWQETMVDKEFSYDAKSYQYLLSNSFRVNGSIHYQAVGWFDIHLSGNWHKTKGGWTDYWGNKYMNPETMLLNIEPGFELQISPSLTVLQLAGFPLKGKNSDAPFYLFTTIRFSNFPFFRK
jgi:hypothetical protein